MLVVSKVGEEAIPTLQQLAEITWKAAYTSILSPNQVKYMPDLFYSDSPLKKTDERRAPVYCCQRV